jgi:hypothetical protein
MIMVRGRESSFQLCGKGAVDGGIGDDVVGQDGHGVAGGVGGGSEDGEGFVCEVFDAGDDVSGCSGGVQQLVEDGFAGRGIAA